MKKDTEAILKRRAQLIEELQNNGLRTKIKAGANVSRPPFICLTIYPCLSPEY